MQIILVHPRLAKAKTLNLKLWHVIAAATGGIASIIGISVGLTFLATQYGEQLGLGKFSATPQAAAPSATEAKLRQELKAMAAQVGQMQVKIMQLDALGERVAGLANIKPQDFNFKQTPGSGGLDIGSRALAPEELSTLLGSVSKDLDSRNDFLSTVETALLSDKLNKTKLPTVRPVASTYTSSGFGWRVDPVYGSSAFHSGLDFPATTGTPIVAAADGIVIAAEHHPQYGNMVDIAHSEGLSTRYAHSSQLFVKVGDRIKRGQTIAAVGSTGKSTGPHLHFEVRVNDVPQNPMTFLNMANDPKLAQVTPLETIDPKSALNSKTLQNANSTPSTSSTPSQQEFPRVDFTPIPVERNGAKNTHTRPHRRTHENKVEIVRSSEPDTNPQTLKTETRVPAIQSVDIPAPQNNVKQPSAKPDKGPQKEHAPANHDDTTPKHSPEVIM